MPRDADSLVDIALSARRVALLVESLTLGAFRDDETVQEAVLYRLVVIGEAVKRLSSEFREAHTEMRWTAIAGLRDVLVHSYDRVSLAEVWDIATLHVPALLAYIEPLVPEGED